MREKDVCHHCGADKRYMARLTRELCEVLEECVDLIDTFYGPPGSNRIDRELIDRARAALAKARGEGASDA